MKEYSSDLNYQAQNNVEMENFTARNNKNNIKSNNNSNNKNTKHNTSQNSTENQLLLSTTQTDLTDHTSQRGLDSQNIANQHQHISHTNTETNHISTNNTHNNFLDTYCNNVNCINFKDLHLKSNHPDTSKITCSQCEDIIKKRPNFKVNLSRNNFQNGQNQDAASYIDGNLPTQHNLIQKQIVSTQEIFTSSSSYVLMELENLTNTLPSILNLNVNYRKHNLCIDIEHLFVLLDDVH